MANKVSPFPGVNIRGDDGQIVLLHTYFSLDYQNSEGAIRYYHPDFLVWLVSGDMWMVETKGIDEVEVARKDARAIQWCQGASAISGITWRYVKVPFDLFQESAAAKFGELDEEISATG